MVTKYNSNTDIRLSNEQQINSNTVKASDNNRDLSQVVEEIFDLFIKTDNKVRKSTIINYLNNHNLTSQEIYNQLLNNENNSNYIFLLGKFYKLGIGTSVDVEKAFKLYQRAANLGHGYGINSLGYCYKHGIGTSVDIQKAFELYQEAANLGNAFGINNLGHCYQNGIGTSVDRQKAFEL